jgi:hypothetical protein
MKNLILILTIAFIGSANAQTPENAKKENIGITAFSYVMTYDLAQVNSTRKEAGASELKGSHYLDSCALARCIRLANIIKANPDKYITDESVFDKEGHKSATTAENVAEAFAGACINKDDISQIKEKDIPTLITKGIRPELFIAGKGYNKSEGHYKNRIDAKHKEYGSYYIVIFVYAKNYNTEGMLERIPTRITLHYELFR